MKIVLLSLITGFAVGFIFALFNCRYPPRQHWLE
ncbi:hypothetical protein N288_23975 [Bacillus infantis NRRL B-14911]|uniref:Uncharacterized protein n=1 Tax=Bacillus infantis NRRL B-14911 TaxID=1367477 RepID=U5LGM5_9BACI|nr:hypothetical protein N288_23975 [Bacillus infantis NRRL B-14911]